MVKHISIEIISYCVAVYGKLVHGFKYNHIYE